MKHTSTAAIFAAGALVGALLLAPQPADAGHNETIPHGAILMFETSCPAGWKSHASLNAGRFPRGGNNATGGDTGHQHRVQAQRVATSAAEWSWQYGTRYAEGDPYGGDTQSSHEHRVEIPEGLTTWQQHLPPHHGVMFCKQTRR